MDYLFYLLFTLLQCPCIVTLKHHCTKLDTYTLQCDVIPKDIQNGITSINVIDFHEKQKVFELNSSYFMSKNWENVRKLKLRQRNSDPDYKIILKDNCFSGLKSLQVLHINIVTQIELDPDVFIGLHNLTLLDMSECVHLSLPKLGESLAGSNKLPNLETLKASRLNIYNGGIDFDTNFAKAIGDKQITTIDFSGTKLIILNVTALFHFMDRLRYINFSNCKMSNIIIDNTTDVQRLENIRVFDMSYSPLTWLPPFIKFVNMTMHHSHFLTKWNYYFYPETVNMSSCIPDPGVIRFMNVTDIIDVPFQWKSKYIIIRHNNIKHLDLNMECNIYKASTVELLDAAGNGLEFLHPSVPECFPNLVKFDLSDNRLNKMAQSHYQLFQRLFQSLSSLKSINLSFNQLEEIPEVMFIKNHELEVIDCSHNELEQIKFTLKYLPKLKVLNLQYNRIQILNPLSINMLNSRITELGNTTTTLDLGNNAISCSKCEAKQFLNWLTHTKSVNISTKDLTCITSNNSRRKLDKRVLQLVNGICKQTMVIIFSTTSIGLIILISLIIIIIIYKRRKRATEREKRGKLVRQLQEGQDQNEFVAFLSYSSEDKHFVDNNVIDNLNENLQNMTGIERNLVCTGDLYLRPGFMILDETTLCIERASVLIVVVSDNYNSSNYCNNELDMAYHLNKPIVLFIKGIVDESLMRPTMKALFKSNVRVLWDFENQEYILKTTWENVCASILDLIIQTRNI